MLYPDDVHYWKEVAEKHYAKIQELHEELEILRGEWSDMKDQHMKITADMRQIQHLSKGW